MARENSSWGYDRIVGALSNLGYTVSDQTVGNVLKDAQRPHRHSLGEHTASRQHSPGPALGGNTIRHDDRGAGRGEPNTRIHFIRNPTVYPQRSRLTMLQNKS
jgi:hypothetical protein